ISPPSYFCGQECFKANYAQHKQVHALAKQIQAAKQLQQQQQQVAPPQPQQQQQLPLHRKMPPREGGTTCALDAPLDMKLSLPTWARSYEFSGPLRPTLLSPKRMVPAHIRRPDYADDPAGISYSEQRDKADPRTHALRIYTDQELNGTDEAPYGLRHTCRMGRQVLDVAGRALRVGVTMDEIDRIVHDACIERDCYPSPLNYYNFPKSVCTSVNEVICHGIPDFRELQDGDIVNLDITTYNAGGYHGDLNETFCVGKVDADGQRLVQTAFECLAAAMAMVKPGTLYRDLGTVIERVAKQHKCSVVRTYCGHGIGTLFHTVPNIPHYAKNKAKGAMKAGHVFTIEPMINLGTSGDRTWKDNWTAVTSDGKRSAQFEHTILVTETGYEILTARENEPVMEWKPELNYR
ncbi:hypothetical protein ACA910_011967, partial [Epithemia clementina (nom. ined.)]